MDQSEPAVSPTSRQQQIRYERPSFPVSAPVRRIPTGPSGDESVLQGSSFRLQLLWEMVYVGAKFGDARSRSHGRETVQLRSVREALHAVRTPEDTPERSHRGAAVRMPALREKVRREAEPEDPPAETPSGSTAALTRRTPVNLPLHDLRMFSAEVAILFLGKKLKMVDYFND